MVRTTDEMLQLVPTPMRESALALGVPQWKVVRQVLYRAALSGILTGVLLALARISGETAPVLFTALNNQYWTSNLNQPMANVPVVIFQYALSPFEFWHALAWAGAFVVVILVLILSLTSRWLVARGKIQLYERYVTIALQLPRRSRTADAAADAPAKLPRVISTSITARRARSKMSISSIQEKRVTALIGPSGCGKSTLLRIFNRMYAIYPKQRAEGEILLDGDNVLDPRYSINRLRTKVGMVFQKPVPFPMSIYDNVAYALRHYESLSRAEMDERVEESLKGAAIWDEVKDKLGHSALGLSGGQQQRLCIARAIALKPEVLLLDEPTSALDPISTAKVEQLIDELKANYTVLIVTHNMQQAARVSDFTGFMFLGELIEFGVTSDMFTHPANKKTEDYITGRFG